MYDQHCDVQQMLTSFIYTNGLHNIRCARHFEEFNSSSGMFYQVKL